MKRALLLVCTLLLLASEAFSQFVSEGRPITGSTAMPSNPKVANRSVLKPTQCSSDTTTYARWGTSAYYSVSIRTGSSLGQFFPTPQPITVSGFFFYGFSLNATPLRPVNIRLRCNVYKAGADSLPTGSPLASDTITVDTVMGSSIPLNRILRKAVFKNPATISGTGFIIAVECDSSSVGAAIITNSWAAGDGDRQNIGCGSVSGKWYRCLQLNISGVTFDANMQYYPFISYKLGTEFTVDNNCYVGADTVRFSNNNKTNVTSSPFYNLYNYYGIEQYSHLWTYDNIYSEYVINGKYKPNPRRNFNTRLITTNYRYYGGQCRDTFEKMVYFKPQNPGPKKVPMACKGDSLTIDIATDANCEVRWYKKATDTTPFNIGYSYKIKSVQKGDTFYVIAINGPCKTTLNRVIVFMNEYPNQPTVTNDSLCSGANANLSAKSNIGFVEWYSSSSGGLPVFVGNNLQTGKLYADSELYVQANYAGCISKGGRVKVKAFVGSAFAPEKPEATIDTFTCLRPSKSITLSATQKGTDTLRWFNQPTGGSVLNKGETYTFTPSKRGDAQYYVETWNGICGSGRTEITVHVYDNPTIFGLTGDTICKGEPAFPYLSIPWGTVNWYDKKTDITPAYSGKNPLVAGLTADKTLYLKTEENGCSANNFDSVKIFVNSAPVPSLVKSDAVCAKGVGTFIVNVPNGKVNWYYESTDDTAFYTGNSLNTGMMLSNITYYYETENKGCKSAKTPITINIKPRPVAGFTWVLQWQNKLVVTPITTSGLTIAWDWGDGKTSTGAPYNHTYTSKGNYTVRMVATSTANGCKDTADIPVIIDHTGTHTLNADGLGVYPVPVKTRGNLSFSGLNGNNHLVEIYSSEGKLVASVQLNGSEMPLPAEVVAGLYFVKISDAGITRTARILVAD